VLKNKLWVIDTLLRYVPVISWIHSKITMTENSNLKLVWLLHACNIFGSFGDLDHLKQVFTCSWQKWTHEDACFIFYSICRIWIKFVVDGVKENLADEITSSRINNTWSHFKYINSSNRILATFLKMGRGYITAWTSYLLMLLNTFSV
jgi:hypothetical protein